jgi:hypothetical protein
MLFATWDWKSQDAYNYLAIAGGAVVLLSLVLYVLPVSGLKLLGRLLGVVGGLALGLGLGVRLMGVWGYQLESPVNYAYPNGPPANMPAGPGRGPMGAVAIQFPMPNAPPGGGQSISKPQLVALVSKLDLLTDKPLAIELSEEQRKEVREQLNGLADAEDLSEDDARARVAALHEVLKDQLDKLEAAGYRRGAAAGFPPGPTKPDANPFKADQNATHLKALKGRLENAAKG